MSHLHYPINVSQKDIDRRPTRAECGQCGRQIVFVPGTASRRDYWRAIWQATS